MTELGERRRRRNRREEEGFLRSFLEWVGEKGVKKRERGEAEVVLGSEG